MKRRTKNLLSVFGVLSLISSITISIPSYLNSNYIGFGVSIIFIIIATILLSFAFGD